MMKRHCDRPLRRFLHVFLFLISTSLGCQFDPQGEVVKYEPGKAYNGYTLYNIGYMLMPWIKYLAVVDMGGQIVWSYRSDTLFVGNRLEPFPFFDAEMMANGHILTNCSSICEIDPFTNTIVWQYSDARVHHDVDLLPDGSLLFLYQDVIETPEAGYSPRITDGIRIVDPSTNEILWDWRAEDYISLDEYCTLCITKKTLNGYDWLHANAVTFRQEPQGDAIYVNFRNINRICKIDVASSKILWSLGDGGDLGEGLFCHAHDPQFLPNGNLLLFDNRLHQDSNPEDGLSRVIEIAFDPGTGYAEIVWEYAGESPFYSSLGGDADRLPNGNTLITDAVNGRIIEITPEKETVWEYKLNPYQEIYKSERLETWSCTREQPNLPNSHPVIKPQIRASE